MNNLKRGLAVAAAAALPLSLAALPANAAGAPEVAGTNTNTYITQTATVTDEGDQDFTITVRWQETYTDNAGNIRVSVPFVKINAVGVNLDEIGDQGIDARIRVYSGYADGHTNKIQDLLYDGADDPLTKNVRNPLNRPGITKIVFTGVGVDGDGLDGAPSKTFLQPTVGDEYPGTDPTT